MLACKSRQYYSRAEYSGQVEWNSQDKYAEWKPYLRLSCQSDKGLSSPAHLAFRQLGSLSIRLIQINIRVTVRHIQRHSV